MPSPTSDAMLGIDPARIPLSLYIHIPWCIKKCPYCDFNSHSLPKLSGTLFDDYVSTLIADARSQRMFVQGRVIRSIFIGGGTPSLLPITHYHRLFAELSTIYDFALDMEVTLEANPGTFEHAPFADYLAMGINRLSLGVQSFDDEILSKLGRIHRRDEAIRALTLARQAGFERINVDLMHGLPTQTTALALHDIDTALQSGATHISWYQLTIEPNTAFYRSPPVLPNEEMLDDIEAQGRDKLIQAGYHNYEISAWVGAADVPCRHNLNYWQFGDYLAIGAGAHGKVSVQGVAGMTDGIYRFYKSRLPKDYICDGTPKMVAMDRLGADVLPFEFMMNALRLAQGVPATLFGERTGLSLDVIADKLGKLKAQGLLVDDMHSIAPSERGYRYANQLMRAFL